MSTEEKTPGELLHEFWSSEARRRHNTNTKSESNITPGELLVGTSYADCGLYYCPICGIYPKGPLFDSVERLAKHFKDKHPGIDITEYLE